MAKNGKEWQRLLKNSKEWPKMIKNLKNLIDFNQK